jgi:hypothetical protein
MMRLFALVLLFGILPFSLNAQNTLHQNPEGWVLRLSAQGLLAIIKDPRYATASQKGIEGSLFINRRITDRWQVGVGSQFKFVLASAWFSGIRYRGYWSYTIAAEAQYTVLKFKPDLPLFFDLGFGGSLAWGNYWDTYLWFFNPALRLSPRLCYETQGPWSFVAGLPLSCSLRRDLSFDLEPGLELSACIRF